MSTSIAPPASMATDIQKSAALVEKVVIGGDLSRLSPAERMMYYQKVCESVGLNPLTRPFDYLVLNGKTVLYAKRDATDQLRKIHGVSVTISSREKMDDVYLVIAKATIQLAMATTGEITSRSDESIGAVNIAALKGDALANALMKAETKAKRRVTLSICGLGLLDETEVETIQGVQTEDTRPAPTGLVDRVRQARDAVVPPAATEGGTVAKEPGAVGAPVVPVTVGVGTAPVARPVPPLPMPSEKKLRAILYANFDTLGIAGKESVKLGDVVAGSANWGPEEYLKIIAVTARMITGQGLEGAKAEVQGVSTDALLRELPTA